MSTSTKVEGCDCTDCKSRNEQGKCDKPGISIGPTRECQSFEYMLAPSSELTIDMTVDGRKADDIREEREITQSLRAKLGRDPTPKEIADARKALEQG